MLESVKRAYDRGAFIAAGVQCPVKKRTVGKYMRILKPLYTLSLQMQLADSSIGDLLPNLFSVIFIFNKFTFRCINSCKKIVNKYGF